MNKKHILIIDDEESTCKAVSRVLKIENFDVTFLTDGEKGFDFIFKNKNNDKKTDILITDIQMPGMNGIELINKLDENEIDIPIIVITAHYEKELIKEFQNTAKIKFLEKPFGSIDLLKIIKEVNF